MSKLLERIIRNILAEGNITLAQETLQPEDFTFINSNIRTPLGISSKDMNFNTLGGLRVTLQRVGHRDTNDETGERSREITPIEFQSNVVLKLNGLRGLYKPMTGPDYVWLITSDLKTDAKRDAHKPKSERLFAKYYSIATYIKTSLIPKTLTESMAGCIDTLSGGALVFNLEQVKGFTEWTRGVNIASEVLVNAPYSTAAFGDVSRVVRDLYAYFNLELSPFNYTVQNKFGCELKGAIQQFQTENGLPVTGDYDDATMKFAFSLKKKEYIFKEQFGVKQFVGQCQIANRQVIDVVNNIVVPEGGFIYGIKGNVEFYRVQQLMLEYFENLLKIPKAEKALKSSPHYKTYTTLKKALATQAYRGDYGDGTQKMVKFLKDGFKMTTSDKVVESEFVNKLKL